jgi:hypothetical protein
MKKCKIRVAQVKDVATKGLTELGSPLAVARIGAVVFPTAIVQKGEQLDDQRIGARLFGDAQAVFTNPLPVRDPVNAMNVHYEPLLGNTDNLLEIDLNQIRCRHDASISFHDHAVGMA